MGDYSRHTTPIIAEGSTPSHSFRVRWRDGQFARLLNIAAAQLSVQVEETGATVNGRAHQNALNVNNVTIVDQTVDGETFAKVTWNLQVADTLSATTNEVETHVATFTFTKTDGEVCTAEIHFPIENLRQVP